MGDTDAQYSIGRMYYEGKGIEKDFTEAAKWFRISAEGGNLNAIYNLADLYSAGEGVRRNPKRAAKLYRMVADRGLPEGHLRLGIMYSIGIGVRADKSMAVRHLEEALRMGCDAAEEPLKKLADTDREKQQRMGG